MAGKARTLTLKTKVEVTGADKLNNLGKKMQQTGRNLTVGITLPLIALGGSMLALAEEAERADAELRRTFESMGAGAWTTVDALKAQQAELQGLTTFGDEEISHLQSVLLTFGNVTGEAFDRATAAALDMSAMLGQDLQSSAIQLGKALNDPIKGITALTRVGVSFTQEQKDQIKVLAESGQVMEAQGIILGELERQFGGAAEAMAGTAGGQMKQALNALGDAGEEFGAVIAPVLRDVADGLKGFAKWLRELNPETKEWVVRIAALAAALGPLLIVVGSIVRVFSGFKAAGAVIIAIAPKIGLAFTLMTGPIGIVIAAIGALIAIFATDFLGIRTAVMKALGPIADFIGGVGDAIGDFIGGISDFFGFVDKEAKGVERSFVGVRNAQKRLLEKSTDDWDEHRGIIDRTINGPGGMVPTAIAGADAMAEELGEMPQKGADALLAEQFQLTDAIAELIEFMDKALDPAQEVFNAQMFLASKEAAAGLASGNPLVVQKTQEMVDAANAVLAQHGKSAFNYGYNFGAEYARGIVNSLGVIKDAGRQMGGALRSIVAIESEPKDRSSPLYGITQWGKNFVKTYSAGIMGSLSSANAASRTLAAALVPALGSAFSPRIAAVAPREAPLGGGGITINITVQGDLKANERTLPGTILRGLYAAGVNP